MKRYPITQADERVTMRPSAPKYLREVYSEAAMRGYLVHGLKELELRTRQFIKGTF